MANLKCIRLQLNNIAFSPQRKYKTAMILGLLIYMTTVKKKSLYYRKH